MIKHGKIHLQYREASKKAMEIYYQEYKKRNPGTIPIEVPFLELFGLSGQPLFRSFQFYTENKQIHIWFRGPEVDFIWYGRVSLKRDPHNSSFFCKRTKKTKW